MGLLALGTPLAWEQAKQYAHHVRTHGITQFLNTWDHQKDREGDTLLWGDEIEYMVLSFDHESKDATLSLRQLDILTNNQAVANGMSSGGRNHSPAPAFHPEYGRFMLESTPGSPYSGRLSDLLVVESDMRYRRSLARNHFNHNEIPLTITSFPRLGALQPFTDPHFDPSNAKSSHSLFLHEEITNAHARFPTLTANIRTRRGSKVAINLPLFFDEKTPRPFVDPTIPWERNIYPEDPEAKRGAALTDHIYMDAMGFGMGCCCLQQTFQACNVDDARRIYDLFVPLAPIFLALTAASPLWRGYIADVDCRWNVVSGSVDDRTEEERGLKPLKHDRFRIPKSRYDSVSLYISNIWMNRPEYNDIEAPYDPAIFQRLQEHGIDDVLAKHISHLFIRDPLVVFSESIDQDDENSTDHFESIQSTNWQTVRFKPPPAGSPIGWRVEFRPMEIQFTDFENAAFAVFVVLLTRAVLSMNLNLYIPISRVDENMRRAHRRDAIHAEKFFFRKNFFSPRSTPTSSASGSGSNTPIEHSNGVKGTNGAYTNGETEFRNCFPPPAPENGFDTLSVHEEYEEMSINQIINGTRDTPGLVCLVKDYLETLDVDKESRRRVDEYLDFVKARANGSLVTAATWIRNFVRTHPAYKFDSVVTQEINYDLLTAIDEIERGVRQAPDLLPKHYAGGQKK